MTEQKLKPCPFCGGDAILYIDCGYYIAECENCEAMSGEHETAEKTIKAWNKRTSCDTCAMYYPNDGCMAGLVEGELAQNEQPKTHDTQSEINMA